ncbi:AraC family transcriptional regulator [Glycomyces harbinensis]|uniref:AraC-type DNA-binding protein n=1 Tax=Glycomyces harbinensis TaxID=58114 RepID=A0A1G7A8X5_9ACTN|nr:AraC family transcriptional regulator [Glycomyces harbinensis]SDE11262.1 AraC-type DNA-binding protein [Glycomyces harbinensis]
MSLEELRGLIIRHARDDDTTLIDGVLLSVAPVAAPPSAHPSGTCLALIAQGAKRIVLGDRAFDYREGQYLVASVDLPVTGQFVEASRDRPAVGFGLTLRPAVIAELLLDHADALAPRDDRGAPLGLTVSDASDELIDAAIRMVRLLERPRDRPVLAPMIEREILWLLINSDQGAAVRQLGLADSSLSHVSRVARWIRDHYAERLRVEDLARMSRLSTSAFHRSFRAVTTMTPIQFQKQIRLHQARLLLATRSDDVTRIGLAVGYDSVSQFSREYRRLFGVPPSEDAARMRGAE